MQLDGLTTPEQIDTKVKDFCKSISKVAPTYINVSPELWCRQSCCEMNVEKLIEQIGGEKVFGYKIWYMPKSYIEAERHVIHKLGDVYRDPTFNTDGEEKILFVPDGDQGLGYEGRRMKIRHGFTNQARRFVERVNLGEAIGNLQRLSNEESWQRMISYEDWLAGRRQPNMWVESAG
jgi:hypothetical protein